MAHLRIMTWNVFQLPDVLSVQGQSLRRRPSWMKLAHYADIYSLDAVILSEVFNEDAHADLFQVVAGPGKRFPFASPRPSLGLGGLNDGGVMILARAGAQLVFANVFSDAIGSDAMAAKGAVGVRIRKGGRSALVVGTHLQASGDTCPRHGVDREADARVIRGRQLREMRGWINAGRAGTERVIVAGDLNVDGGGERTAEDSAEYQAMLSTLGVSPARGWASGTTLRHSYDPSLNTLAQRTAGGDFRARLLDHVLTNNPPASARQWITWPRTSTAWRRQHVSLSRCDAQGNTESILAQLEDRDLSDHLPLVAEIPIA